MDILTRMSRVQSKNGKALMRKEKEKGNLRNKSTKKIQKIYYFQTLQNKKKK